MSSVRVVVGRGRLGVAFKGRHVIYKESKFRWRAVTRTQARYDDASPWTVIGTKSITEVEATSARKAATTTPL